MANIKELAAIRAALDIPDAIARIEAGFVAYSQGKVTVPPVGHMDFPSSQGECHIKYGHIHGDENFVIKVATGFYENAALGLPTGDGLMLVFSAQTGKLDTILMDGGYLTDVRTAIAGSISAKHLAPSRVERIGIIGGGVQARMQLEYLRHAIDCRDAVIWARRKEQCTEIQQALMASGISITIADSVEALCESCNLIVTTTPAIEPILNADWIRPGTHITAVGSDGAGKQELPASIYQRVDLAVADSMSQCLAHGESHFAVRDGYLDESALVELGEVIAGSHPGRQDDDQITVADLTGVAFQDIAIANTVCASRK